MIKVIFFDIDGTLLTNKGRIAKNTKKAISALHKKGIVCGVSTARTPKSIAHILKDLPFDLFIACNGQLVYTKEQMIYERAFEAEALAEIVSYADQHFRQMILCGKNHSAGSWTMRFGQSHLLLHFMRFVPHYFPIRKMKRLLQKYSPNRRKQRYSKLAILKEPIYQCVMLSPEYENERLAAALPYCDFKRSNPYSVDLVPKGSSKLAGLKFLVEHLGIKLEETMVFGDHLNDIEIIQGAGIGVAMGNATVKTKQAADYVTATNNQDGITAALRYFNLIKK
ncbi:Cof-type HAD-IIB family hydrolase [Tetragenococcus halophilus]|uniref:Cof-type HAD-IIB family hydrolase n=1 Tax=Tetragenococcus halophilus TaxID=51669 RepID=A0A3G5FIM4_TETHA|nr:Cof-type HAD-IIB family hydrolase [Tetragenococcus halophilus]AYW49978.1 Cof-type HAD-IIB family hydrolase [Tetragenococcus halophilus]GBD64623.1 putative hydrolase [Tetragenococcus halophilus subsp. flandriensis]